MARANRDHEPAWTAAERLAAGLVGVTFLVAAIFKAWDAPSFTIVLRHLFPWLPGGVGVVALASAVVMWEAALAFALLGARPPRRALRAAIATLLAFSCVLVWLRLDPYAPRCACTGLLRAAHGARAEATRGLVRNAAMISLVGWVYARRRALGAPAPAPEHAPGHGLPGGAGAPAFTLVEVLVSISVVAVLVALVVPSLRNVRETARDARVLATERQLLSSLALYSADHKEAFPYFHTEGDPLARPRIGDVVIPHSYFWAGRVFWANLVCPNYFDADLCLRTVDAERDASVNVSEGLAPPTIRSRVWLTQTAFAAPQYWDADAPPNDRLLRHTTHAELLYPASKGLLMDIVSGVFAPSRPSHPPRGDEAMTIGFGDGSAASVVFDFRDTSNVVDRPHGAAAWPVMSTRRGLAGRDR
jgi:prepilin-type N-terminal cleavage/methylation domain-containing protein